MPTHDSYFGRSFAAPRCRIFWMSGFGLHTPESALYESWLVSPVVTQGGRGSHVKTPYAHLDRRHCTE